MLNKLMTSNLLIVYTFWFLGSKIWRPYFQNHEILISEILGNNVQVSHFAQKQHLNVVKFRNNPFITLATYFVPPSTTNTPYLRRNKSIKLQWLVNYLQMRYIRKKQCIIAIKYNSRTKSSSSLVGGFYFFKCIGGNTRITQLAEGF